MNGKGKDRHYFNDKFHFDLEGNYFTCPSGEVLICKGIYTQDTGKKIHAYYDADCGGCLAQIECKTTEKLKSVITCSEYEPDQQRISRKMKTSKAKIE